MTEPKVVHEFSAMPPLHGLLGVDEEREQLWYRPLTREWWEPLQDEDIPQFVMATANELARLAARVQELESCYEMCCRDRDALSQHESVLAENKRLRKALKGHQRWLELLEWAQPGHEDGDDRFYCINCGQYEENGGHSENCEWAESIREGRAALKEKP